MRRARIDQDLVSKRPLETQSALGMVDKDPPQIGTQIEKDGKCPTLYDFNATLSV